jgi:hypothetical protein
MLILPKIICQFNAVNLLSDITTSQTIISLYGLIIKN